MMDRDDDVFLCLKLCAVMTLPLFHVIRMSIPSSSDEFIHVHVLVIHYQILRYNSALSGLFLEERAIRSTYP
jgi:hypothetical protein